MNRRIFLAKLVGLVTAPALAAKVLSTSPKTKDITVLTGLKGRVYMSKGFVYAPYIPYRTPI